MFIRIRLLAEWQCWCWGALCFFSWIILHERFLDRPEFYSGSNWDMLIGQIEYEILESKIWHFWQERYIQLESPVEATEWSPLSEHQVVYLNRTIEKMKERNAALSVQD